MTIGGSLQGASGQDTGGGISKYQLHLLVFRYLQNFYFHMEKYEQMGIELSPEKESSNIVYLSYKESCFQNNCYTPKIYQIEGTIMVLIRCAS